MMGSPASGRTDLCSEDINHDEDAADSGLRAALCADVTSTKICIASLGRNREFEMLFAAMKSNVKLL
jgi:hypothetical protein